jgi:hypothetical protein
MPHMCFSYAPDVPPDSQNLSAMRSAQAGLRQMPFSCLSYPQMCFGYPVDGPLGNRDAAQPALPGLRGMPFTCFRY